jgi:hypothetical protein
MSFAPSTYGWRAMRKILTGDRITVSRSGVARHALSATTLLLVGFLVVAFAQLGGGPSASTINRGQPLPTCSTATTATTAAAFAFGGHTKTVTKTLWKTKTKTVTHTRTKTLCTFVTVTEPGSTTTVTVTEKGPTSTETTTQTVIETGPTTTVTETKTVTATQSGSGPGFTCPPTDQLGFAVGDTDYTSDPIFCSYPAVAGEDPNDFFCTYSASTGVLVTDHDAGLCTATAPAKP